MEKSHSDIPSNAIEAWKSHLALSSGSERSDGASSRGSSSIGGAELSVGQTQSQPWAREHSRPCKEEAADQHEPDQAVSDDEEEDDDSELREEDDGESSSGTESEGSEQSIDEEDDEESSGKATTTYPSVFSFADPNDSPAPPSPHILPNDEAEAMVQLLKIQEQEGILYSPRPQRKYRPTVTAAYEPTPLPLYDHNHLVPTHVPPQYLYHFPQPGQPWQHHGPNLHPQTMYPQGSQTSIRYPEAPEAPLPGRDPLGDRKRREKLAGHELIASKLTLQSKDDAEGTTCRTGPFPLYRRFEELNHRILLHLQDEISELEEDLHQLDEEMLEMETVGSMERRHSPGPCPPSSGPSCNSRDSHLAGSLRYQRTELLGRTFLKLGQYNQALASHSGTVQKFRAAEKREIDSYKSWMQQQCGEIDGSEMRFLEHGHDLVSLSRSATSPGGRQSGSQLPEELKDRRTLFYLRATVAMIGLSIFYGFQDDRNLVLALALSITLMAIVEHVMTKYITTKWKGKRELERARAGEVPTAPKGETS